MVDETTTMRDPVTLTSESPLTLDDEFVVGEEYMLMGNPRCSAGSGDVYFGNTEPIRVTVADAGYAGTGRVRNVSRDVYVSGLNQHGSTVGQWVGPEYLRRITEPTPDPHALGTPYRVTETGGHGFDVGTIVYVATPSATAENRRGDTGVFVTRRVLDDYSDPLRFVHGYNAFVRTPTSTAGVRGRWRANVEPLTEQVVPRTRGTVQVGDWFRVTGTTSGHGFVVGTEAQVATCTTNGGVTSGDSLYLTTTGNLSIPPWCSGESAFVAAFDSSPECVFLRPATGAAPEPEPERAVTGSTPEWPIVECDHRGHTNRPHYHAQYRGDSDFYEYLAVQEDTVWHTVQDQRFAKGFYLPGSPEAAWYEEHRHLFADPSIAGTTPDWPIRECEFPDHGDAVHFHLVRHGETDVNTEGRHVYEDGSWHTLANFRWAKGAALPHADHGSTPEWDVESCDDADHPVTPHYHVRDAATGLLLFDHSCVEVGSMSTVQNRRFTGSAPSSGQDVPPPEEVLRLLDETPSLHEEFEVEREQIRDLLAEVNAARAAVDAARQERAQWVARLIERSRVVARQQDWCGVYDRGMRDLGLPDRHGWTPPPESEPEPSTETVTETALIEVSVPFDEDQFESWLRREVDSEEWSSIDSNTTYFTVNLRPSQDRIVESESCACDEDEDHWRHLIPSWVSDNGFDWSVAEVECSND
jgi:hypothetical protein